MGNVPMDAISVKQIGPCVQSILDNSEQYLGKYVGLSSQKSPGAEYAQILSQQLAPRKFVYDPDVSYLAVTSLFARFDI